MKFVVIALTFCGFVSVSLPLSGATQDSSRLFRDFRSNELTSADKRFLQAALAFEGHYSGLMDGDWETISQKALNSYASKNFAEPATDWHKAMLAISLFQRVQDEGWSIRYLDSLGMSILVPADAVREGNHSEAVANFSHTNSSLSYSLVLEDEEVTQWLHDFTENFNEASEPPFSLRKQNIAVTSSKNAQGKTIYTHSHFVRGRWSTIMLSADAQDSNILGAVTSSIATGWAEPVMFTEDGELHRAISEVPPSLASSFRVLSFKEE